MKFNPIIGITAVVAIFLSIPGNPTRAQSQPSQSAASVPADPAPTQAPAAAGNGQLAQLFTPAQPFTWTGFYFGGSLGARQTDTNWNTTCIDPTAYGNCPNTPVSGYNGTTANFDNLGVKGGIYLGHNWQVMLAWVVGVEGDFGWGDNKQTNAGIPGAETVGVAGSPGADTTTIEQTWDASVRLRGGYLVMPRVMVFATSGPSFTQMKASMHCGTLYPVGWCINPANIGRTDSQSTIKTGWTLGGGVEAAVWGNWLARAEYRYADYGTLGHSFMQNPSPVDQVNANMNTHTHTFQLGLAYKW